MRRRLATTRVPIRSKALPKSAVATGLNYRTNVTTPRQDGMTTARFVLVVTTAFIAIAFLLRLVSLLPNSAIVSLFIFVAIDVLGIAYARFITKRPTFEHLSLFLAVLGVSGLSALVTLAPTTTRAYQLLFGVAVAGSAVLSYFITQQICHFMAVNERIEWQRMRHYQNYWGLVREGKTPRGCPEIAVFRQSFAFLPVAFVAGYLTILAVERSRLSEYASMLGVVGFLGSLLPIWLLANEGDHAPKVSFFATIQAAKTAFTTFVCYNRHGIHAAGLFHFPTPFLRSTFKRDATLGATIAVLTTAFVCITVSSPLLIIERQSEALKKATAPLEPFQLNPVEERFSLQLEPEKRKTYFEEKRAAWEAVERIARQTPEESFFVFLARLAGLLLFCGLGPGLTLFAVLWFTGGRLLLRYHHALEAPDAYEVRPQPTEKELAAGHRVPTPWDNRIERIRRSSDPLETEHFYLGAALEGDFPVLYHQDLSYGHAHILGDSGSRKTSTGIAPYLTQLIDRQDCSVLVIDLKGDKALFEAAREEADAAGIPFKWFSNITGVPSFVFNPFAQSHVPSLTTNQLTEGIMQALALDYGEDYGRGFYSALNDLVLGGYLKRYRKHVSSFKELHRFVSDKSAFSGIGSDSDWEKTRHVARVIEKLADVESMNLTAPTPEAPRAIEEQIDLPAMLREKQVVYFYLSSIQEQSNAQKMAKLAMFSLLTAADRRPKGDKNRVYVFVDEFQRVVSENVSIFFEQARSKRLHFILANQTIGQLDKQGVKLTDVVESNTAFKQSFRATDEKSIKRLMETSGEAVYHSLQWTEFLNDAFDDESGYQLSVRAAMRQSEDGDAMAKVGESVGPRLEMNTIIDVSARPLASFVRFTESSGYTQYSGNPFAMLSEYHITKALFGYREESDWPEPDGRTVIVTEGDTPTFPSRLLNSSVPIPMPTNIPGGFDDDLERRINEAS